MSKSVKTVVCNKCLRAYVSVGLDRMYNSIREFNIYLQTLSEEERNYFPNRAVVSSYVICHCGNPYTNFRVAEEKDVPSGVTMSEILDFKD